MDIEEIAGMCHEVNRLYCRKLGDFSQLGWDEAPAWQRESAIKGVQHALENPNAKPSDSHESWLAEKKAASEKVAEADFLGAGQQGCGTGESLAPVDQGAVDVEVAPG